MRVVPATMVAMSTTDTGTRTADLPSEHDPLRRDVGWLGALLGRVIVTQGGEALYERVEAARRSAIARRAGEPDGERRLAAALEDLDPNAAGELARAFSSYFSLVNLAEQGAPDPAAPLRPRGSGVAPGRQPVGGDGGAGSFRGAAGASAGGPVRSEGHAGLHRPPDRGDPAHASCARSSASRACWSTASSTPQPTPQEAAARSSSGSRRRSPSIWQTDEQPSRAADGGRRGRARAVLPHRRDLPGRAAVLRGARARPRGGLRPGRRRRTSPAALVRFGSWVGGDMDGNPNVGADTILATLERQRELVLERYRARSASSSSTSASRASRVGVSTEVARARSRATAQLMPDDCGRRFRRRYRDMPYRVLLWLIWARLGATLGDAPRALPGPDELRDDLERDRRQPATATGASTPGSHCVRRLPRRVATFGFHLATLDVRQDAVVHRRALAELLAEPGFADAPAAARARAAARRSRAACRTARAGCRRRRAGVLDVFRAVGEARAPLRARGDRAVHHLDGAGARRRARRAAAGAGRGTGRRRAARAARRRAAVRDRRRPRGGASDAGGDARRARPTAITSHAAATARS